MDNMNVIIPTNNLDKLEQDMAEWSRLPYKFKKLSNDACMQKYNCTVYDLYTRLKTDILNKQADDDTDPDNLVVINTESADDEGFYDYSKLGNIADYENYDGLLQTSNALCRDPNIVIINPTDSDTYMDKYDRYNHLIQKFKTFSNDYSIQLWGYNVPNMYEKVKAQTSTMDSDVDQNNIIINKVDEAYMPLINKIITESASCTSNANYTLFLNTDDPMEKRVFKENVEAQQNLNVSIPKVVPWFTITEMDKLGIKFTHTNPNTYLKAIREAKTDEEKLNLGWNPSLEPNEKSFEVAQNRQRFWFDMNAPRVTDVKNTSTVFTSKPIFIAIENPLPPSSEVIKDIDKFTGDHYTRYMIIVDDIAYMADEDGIFRQTDINQFKYLEIIAIFCDEYTYEKIKNRIDQFQSINNDSGNLYKFILNRQSPLDRTKEKMVYGYICNQLTNIAGIDKTSNNYFVKGFYRLFRGDIDELDPDRVKATIKIIQNKY